jgi:ABC-type glutathione transport system ATPase component
VKSVAGQYAPAVSASDLSVRYGSRRADSRNQPVNGVTFELARGETLAIIGESGSGKSTLVRAIAGMAGLAESTSPQITGGSLTVLGEPMRTLTKRRRDRLTLRVGFVPQDAASSLNQRLTVGENIAAPIYSRDPHFDQLHAGIAVATLVDAVRLPLTTMNKHPHELSRGQLQRVAIARALVLEPELLIADDPTAGIDLSARKSILDTINDLHVQRQFSAVVVSHTISEVRRFSDRVAVMHRGVIVGIGGVDEILDAPQHEYIEGLARALSDIKTAEELSVL